MDEQRQKIFLDRYAARDFEDNLLERNYSDLIDRVSFGLAEGLNDQEKFENLLEAFKFVPGGRILSSTGRDSTLFNCFVLALAMNKDHGADSRKAIMHTITNMIEVCARGGGVGINWSTLRPKGEYISGVNGRSSGAIAWMRGADAMADQIRQGGTRTAALMWMLNDWHPDMLDFANMTERFKRANYSVGISDKFMRAVEQGEDWDLIFPDVRSSMYDEYWQGDIEDWRGHGNPVKTHHTLGAQTLFHDVCASAGRLGSPGLVFMDTCNRMSNTWWLDRLQATNPCGEMPLPAYGSCNLGSMNLTQMWNEGEREIDRNKLFNHVNTAVRLLDRVTDVSRDILTEIGDEQRRVRRVGLGTMGLADVLIQSEIRYGSEECLEFIDEVYGTIRDAAYCASIALAREQGVAPGFNLDKYMQSGFIQTLPDWIQCEIEEHGVRNLTLLSQAPTGTTSLLAGVSSGIEPIFAREYVRRDATGEHLMIHPLFAGRDEDFLVTAHDVTIEEHIAVQARVQKYVDSAVSKTINMSSCATIEQIGKAYELAWHSGCKGITVFRDGSFEGVCEICEQS